MVFSLLLPIYLVNKHFLPCQKKNEIGVEFVKQNNWKSEKTIQFHILYFIETYRNQMDLLRIQRNYAGLILA